MIIQCLVVTHLLPSCDAFLCFLLYRRRLRIFFVISFAVWSVLLIANVILSHPFLLPALCCRQFYSLVVAMY